MTTRIVALGSILVLCAACGLAPFDLSVRAGSDPSVQVECPGPPAVPPGACASWGDSVLATLVEAGRARVREAAEVVRLERAGVRRCRAIVLDARGVGRWIGRAACPV